jgi:hypothetical protein
MVTWAGLFALITMLIALVKLVHDFHDDNKK